MSEMVERVARAISTERWGREEQFDMESDAWREAHRDMASAAIAAMREPTERMKTIGDRASLRKGAHDCEVPMSSVWRAMIDEALK